MHYEKRGMSQSSRVRPLQPDCIHTVYVEKLIFATFSLRLNYGVGLSGLFVQLYIRRMTKD